VPIALSVPGPPVVWDHDFSWPYEAGVVADSAGSPTALNALDIWQAGGSGSQDAKNWTPETGSSGGTGVVRVYNSSGMLMGRLFTTGAFASHGLQFPMTLFGRLQLNDIGAAVALASPTPCWWLRLWLQSASSVGSGVDNTGVSIIPYDGVATAQADRAAGGGGWGFFTDAGSPSGWRWASYDAAPALLDSIQLPGTGLGTFHVADHILVWTATAPLLTVRWDGADVFTGRAIPSAELVDPESVKSRLWTLVCYMHATALDGGIQVRLRSRSGRFHPDGYPIQAEA